MVCKLCFPHSKADDVHDKKNGLWSHVTQQFGMNDININLLAWLSHKLHSIMQGMASMVCVNLS